MLGEAELAKWMTKAIFQDPCSTIPYFKVLPILDRMLSHVKTCSANGMSEDEQKLARD